MPLERVRRHVERRKYLRRSHLDAHNGLVAITRNRRTVRLTVTTTRTDWNGKPNAASHAFVDLDDEMVDWLVRRLSNVRGGKLR